MIGFTTPLDVRDLQDGRNFQLLRSLVYLTEVPGTGGVIRVPKGFVTDFASIPRALWSIFPPQGKYSAAAVVHDYTYRRTIWDRSICDAVFLEAMQSLGVGWLTRHLIHRGVRLFGGHARHLGHPSDESSLGQAGQVGSRESVSVGAEEAHREERTGT